jgi:O-antigen/teichoic acid export membrane protein
MSETYGDGWGEGLKRRVVLASAWAIATSIVGQGIRFASILILSRLLFPEAFGMMALVAAVMSGLEMFSDLGIGLSVVRNREPTRRFLDTMWSLQVVRGWVLWAISLVLAYPVARWYGEPMLFYLIPAAGVANIVRGYAHPYRFTLNRELKLRELFHLEVGSQIVGFVISAIAAYEMRSVWALVIGGLANAIAWSLLTYWLAPEPRSRWCWDREVLRDFSGFSRWIMLSTVLSFVTNQGNALILGSFANIATLGLYSIANSIVGAMLRFDNLLATGVLFPLYVQIGAKTTPLLKRRIAKIRLARMAALLPPLWALTCFGDWFVGLLWDPRYHDAGVMLQILCAGNLVAACDAGPLYLARGESWIGFMFGGVKTAVLLSAMAVGGHYFGVIGLVWGIAICQAIDYPLVVWVQRRYGVWLPWLDALTLGSSAIFITLGFLLRSWLQF